MRCRQLEKYISFYSTLVIISTVLTACSQGNILIASFRSTDHFILLSSDKRVLYEPGAENYANEIALLLPDAIHKIEQAQYLPFKDEVAVYICASVESCIRQTGQKAAATVTNKLFISPALFQDKKPVGRYLTHELSHLELLQRLGTLKFLKLPAWFKEGLAEIVSGGATGSQTTDEEAEKSIIEGKSFSPDEGRSLLMTFLFPRYGSYWKLSQPMFYHQSMLFVKHLYVLDETAFHKLLIAIQRGEGFKNAVSESYNNNLASLWAQYVQGLKARAN